MVLGGLCAYTHSSPTNGGEYSFSSDLFIHRHLLLYNIESCIIVNRLEGVPPLRKFYLFVARFFAVIFAILFVITATLVVILFGPGRQLFHSSLYKNALSNLDVYRKIPEIASDYLSSSILINPCGENPDSCENNPTEITLPSFLINLPAEDRQALLKIFLPPAEIQTMTESTLDGLFSFLHGDSDQISVSMGVLKDNLTGTAGEDALNLFITSLPPCSEAEAAKLSVIDTTIEIVALCKPHDELLSLIISNLRQQLELTMVNIPDVIVFSLPYTPTGASTDGVSFGEDPLTDIRLGLNFLPWIHFCLCPSFWGSHY